MAKERGPVELRSNLESLRDWFQRQADRPSDLNHALAASISGWPQKGKHNLPFWFLMLHDSPKADANSNPIHVIGLVRETKTKDQCIHLCHTLFGLISTKQVEDFQKRASDAFSCVVQARKYVALPFGLKLPDSASKRPKQHYLRWLLLLHCFSCVEDRSLTLKAEPFYFTDDNAKYVADLLEHVVGRRTVDRMNFGDFEKNAAEKLDTWACQRLRVKSMSASPGYFAALRFDVFTASVEAIDLLLTAVPPGISRSSLWWNKEGQPHWGDRILECRPQVKTVLSALCRGPVSPKKLAQILVPTVHNDTVAIKKVLINSGRNALSEIRQALWDAGARWAETKTDLIKLRDYQKEKKYTLALDEDRIRQRPK